MKGKSFSLLVHGSNDTGVERLNPLTMEIFDITIQASSDSLGEYVVQQQVMTVAPSVAIFSKVDSTLER